MNATIKEKNFNIKKLYNNEYNKQIAILDLKKFNYLEWIESTHNNINKIINICKHVLYLNCQINCIIELNDLPPNLNTLNCSFNQLIHLNNLPPKLKRLICHDNNIIELNNLPTNLEYLDCSMNPIKSLDNLPFTLISLVCGNDELNNLDFLPDSIKYLEIKNKYAPYLKFDVILENLPIGLLSFICNDFVLENVIYDRKIWKVCKYFELNKLEKIKYIQPKPLMIKDVFTLNHYICNKCNELNINCCCYMFVDED